MSINNSITNKFKVCYKIETIRKNSKNFLKIRVIINDIYISIYSLY